MSWRTWLCLGLSGCVGSDITIAGIIFSAHDSDEGLGGVTVTVNDESNAPWDHVVTDAEGVFAALAPRGSAIHVEVTGDGLVPLSFSGQSGVEYLFAVPNGVLYAMSTDEAASWRAQFAGCPGADAGGGMIVGVIRLQLSSDTQDDLANVPEINGFAYAEGDDGTRHDACYLNDDGVALAPEADVAGKTGRFAIFGVEGGPFRMAIGRRMTSTSTTLTESFVYVPVDGAVSFQPAFVPL